jgi:TolB-like protein
LTFVVQATLSGETNKIKQYTIAVEAFGYSENFDPQINSAMRTHARRLRKALHRYYSNEGTRDSIRIEIPKRTYIPAFRLNTMPPAEDTYRSSTRTASESIVDYGLSIAVIPFSDQSPDPSHNFADNVTESIVVGLSHFHELSLVGPLPAHKDRFIELDEIGRKYHVRFLLQGRVNTYGNTLRVSVGLTDTSIGFKVWSQTYEYIQTPENLLEIEDDVSRRIIDAVADYSGIIPCLIGRESVNKPPESLKSYEAICIENFYMTVFTTQAHCAALAALEHAAKADPDNALVLAMLANAYSCNNLFDIRPGTPTLDKAERLLMRALALDPKCSIAHVTEAALRFQQCHADRCIAKIQTANSINPFNIQIGLASGILYCMMGRWEEGLQRWNRASHLNPNHPPFYFIVPFMDHYRRRDYETAWHYAVRFNTPMFWDPLIRAATAGQLGLHAQAMAALQELLEMRSDFPYRSQDMMLRLLYLDEHVEMLLDGLFKAGLKLEDA